MCRLTGAALVVFVLQGCGSGETARTVPTVPVTGSVTYAGKPVEGATVVFSPSQTGPAFFPAQAITNAEGKFELRTSFGATTDALGAVPGGYNVTIVKTKAANAGSTGRPSESDMSSQMGSANKNRSAGPGSRGWVRWDVR